MVGTHATAMEPSTNDRQPDPSSDSELSKTQSPTAATENGQAADSLFDGDETPASESQSQTPAPSQPGNQDNDNQGPGAQSHSEASPPTSETQTSAHPEGRPETQNESQQHTQPAPPRLNNSSIPSSTAPHPNGHPNTNTTANNGPPPGGPHTNIHPRPAPSPHPNGLYGMLCPPPPDPGPKPVPPAPVVHGPFTYDEDGFKALAFKRETPYNLHMIMRDPNAAPPVEPVAKAWFHAQLIHYGIPVHQSPLGAEPLPQDLFSALETALRNETIKEGKLPPANILTIEDNLRRQFKDIYKQYQEAFRYWEQQTFARCNTPNDEINCNLDLFMAKYFLRGIRGPPDPKKSRYPIILHKLNDYDGVRKVVKAVPGLRSHMMPLWSVICWEEYGIERAIEEAFASISASHPSITMHVPTLEAHFHIDHFLSKYWLTGLYGRPMPMLTPEPIVIEGWFGGPDIRNILTQAVLRVPDLRVWAFIGNGIDKTVIGWGDKPFHLVEHMRKTSLHQQVASAAPQRVEVQGNPTWDLALRPHFQLCQVKADLLQSNPQHAYEPFEIQELVGSWLVRCPDLENGGWGGRPGEMTIDILNWPVDSYGLVASINLKVALGTMILARSEQLLDELSAYLLHDREVLPHIPHQKRRRGDDFFVAYPRRRSPYEPVPPMRIFFDWIGRRADEFNVELDMDPSNRNRGWVDIDMNNKVFGKGWLKYVKFFGKDNPVAFSMYKVTDQPKKMPEQWSNFRPKEMEAQLQRRVQEQMQRPIAEPNWPSTSTSTNIMITSKIPKPASDHTLPPRPPRPPPPRPPSTTPSPTIKITSKIPKPASDHTLPQQPPGPPPPPTQAPPTDLPGFQRIRPREPPQGIQIGLHTVPAKKRTRPKEGHNKAPRVVDDVQKQGNAAAREGGEGQGERATSTWTPTEGEGREEGYRSAEEEEEEEEQDDGREKGQKDEQQAIDDGQQGDEEEQGEKEKAQAHEGEQEEGRKEQEQQPEKGAQQDEEEDQNQEEQEDQGDEEEEEDDLEGIYQTPAEEVPPSAAPWTEPDAEEQQKDGGDGQQEQKDDQQDAVEEEDDRDVDRDDEEKEQEERQEQQQEDGEELDDQPEKEKEKEEDGRPTKEQGSSAL